MRCHATLQHFSKHAYTGARQALEIIFADQLCLGRDSTYEDEPLTHKDPVSISDLGMRPL
jgi:hypothetical protein